MLLLAQTVKGVKFESLGCNRPKDHMVNSELYGCLTGHLTKGYIPVDWGTSHPNGKGQGLASVAIKCTLQSIRAMSCAGAVPLKGSVYFFSFF